MSPNQSEQQGRAGVGISEEGAVVLEGTMHGIAGWGRHQHNPISRIFIRGLASGRVMANCGDMRRPIRINGIPGAAGILRTALTATAGGLSFFATMFSNVAASKTRTGLGTDKETSMPISVLPQGPLGVFFREQKEQFS